MASLQCDDHSSNSEITVIVINHWSQGAEWHAVQRDDAALGNPVLSQSSRSRSVGGSGPERGWPC